MKSQKMSEHHRRFRKLLTRSIPLPYLQEMEAKVVSSTLKTPLLLAKVSTTRFYQSRSHTHTLTHPQSPRTMIKVGQRVEFDQFSGKISATNTVKCDSHLFQNVPVSIVIFNLLFCILKEGEKAK